MGAMESKAALKRNVFRLYESVGLSVGWWGGERMTLNDPLSP